MVQGFPNRVPRVKVCCTLRIPYYRSCGQPTESRSSQGALFLYPAQVRGVASCQLLRGAPFCTHSHQQSYRGLP